MHKKIFTRPQMIVAGADLLSLNLLFFSVYRAFEYSPGINLASYSEIFLLVNITWIALSQLGKLYDQYTISSVKTFLVRSIQVYTGWFLAILSYWFISSKTSRSIDLSDLIGTFLLGQSLVFVITRIGYFSFFRYMQAENRSLKKIVILGYNNKSKKIVRYLEEGIVGPHILGFCEDTENVTEFTHYPVLSGVEEALKTSIDLKVNEIYSTISPEEDPRIYKIMEQAELECIRFKIFPDPAQYINYPAHLSYLKDMPVLTMRKEPLNKYSNRFLKRLLDVSVSLFVTIFVLSWLLPILGILILLESPGPVLFVQYRSGRNKRPFSCLKLRSMYVNKESDTQQATRDDARFTKVGKFIRHTSLDEFPQFINVLLGNMSLVGPRPHMLKHTEDFAKMVNKYPVRHFLKPGITGWAQIKSYRGAITESGQVEARTEHDIWYLENWSLSLDIRIMFLTVLNKIKGEKDAF